MQAYTKVYLEAFGLDESDFCKCELCPLKATEIHHILSRKKYAIGLLKIENIMAICRACHQEYGDLIYTMPMLLKIHQRILELKEIPHDPKWFEFYIRHYTNLTTLKQ